MVMVSGFGAGRQDRSPQRADELPQLANWFVCSARQNSAVRASGAPVTGTATMSRPG